MEVLQYRFHVSIVPGSFPITGKLNRIDAVHPSSPDRSLAPALLQHLLQACQAQQGAIVIVPQYLLKRLSSGEGSSLSGDRRVFALHYIGEHEVLAMLAAMLAEGKSILKTSDDCWGIWQFPLSSSPATENKTYEVQNKEAAQYLYTPQALLLLGWSGDDYATRVQAGQKVLPYLADAAGSIVAHMLLAERAYDLESFTDHRAIREMELLKSELLATVSHELRSPLASIKGYAATLLRHENRISREERHEFLVAINNSSSRLEVVINRLLEISQLETGTLALERTAVDLAYLVREAVTAMQHRYTMVEENATHDDGDSDAPPRIHFSVHVEDMNGQASQDDLVIYADRPRLREMLDNLLENAVIYSPDDEQIDILIRPLDATSEEGQRVLKSAVANIRRVEGAPPLPIQKYAHWVHIQICDNGIGIPQGQLERIFDRFHRVDTRLTREVNGLGLGLTICKRIAEMHEGAIWAESELGKGSIFHILLPVDDMLLVETA